MTTTYVETTADEVQMVAIGPRATGDIMNHVQVVQVRAGTVTVDIVGSAVELSELRTRLDTALAAF